VAHFDLAIIGTHALIEDNVIFKRLGFVAIDEQHRFGVLQRKRLMDKAAAHGHAPHVLVLTARDTLDDRVTGLDGGADDYLVKPFAFEEVLARIRALLRRGRVSEPLRLRVGDLDVDIVTRKILRGGRPVELTVREFELLEYLLRHHGQTVSRGTLARDVWKETARSTSLDNVIDVHIARLRRKVDLDQPVKLIHTVRGVGFMVREGEP
jgi:DNA-binding response OmpR family regulator